MIAAARRLSAILAADVAGYSRLMGADEEGTLARLKTHRRELIDPTIAEHRGRIVKTTGDGLLVEFASVVDAVRCAVEIQRAMRERETDLAADRIIQFRIGVNVGDILIDGDDIHGDGVNVAARLESLAEPGTICLSGGAWDQARGKVSATADDLGEKKLKNIERPVRVYRISPDAAPVERPALALPDKPSIAVLPFQNMSGDPEQEYFADGMVEDIITALSRFKSMFVIARNSSFVYKGRAVDVKQVARDLGVRYVLEGSVRKGGQKVRITGQLIDASNGAHLWADRFDGTLEDVFDLQDQVTMSVVGAIEPKLRQAEIERARRKPTESLDAYDHLLRAYPHFHALTREGNEQALAHINQALSLDPNFSSAAGLGAWCYLFRRAQGWVGSIDDEAREAQRLVSIVADGERDDPLALAHAAQAKAFIGRDYDAAVALMDHALKLNANSFSVWNSDGWIRLYVHDPDRAVKSFTRAYRLNPLDPLAVTMMSGLSLAHWCLGDFAESLRWARLAVHANPKFTTAHRVLTYALVATDRLDEARSAARELMKLDPSFSITHSRTRSAFQKVELMEPSFAALRAAGIPE